MNEEEIIRLYTEECKSTYDIAEKMSTYPNKIRRILLKHGIKIKTKSEAQKNALKSGKAKIPTQGKKRTLSERVRISNGLQARWENISDADYKKHVDKARDRWNNMPKHEKEKMSQSAIQAIQKAGKEGSKLEKYIREELSRHGFTVEYHKKNIIPNENLEIDMYLPEIGAIIEVDGPSHFLPIWGEDKLRKQIKADENKTGLILSKGLMIIRIKNLADSVSLASKEKLKERLIKLLDSVKIKFPKQSERYVEIEI